MIHAPFRAVLSLTEGQTERRVVHLQTADQNFVLPSALKIGVSVAMGWG